MARSRSSLALEGLTQTTYDTVLPVWLAADRSVGGFSMDKKDLAWVVSFVCPMQMATCPRCVLHSHIVVLLPVVSRLCGTKQACIVLSLIQVVILACHPIVSALNHVSLQNTITVLYSVISSFHIIRSILFKYPCRVALWSLTPPPSSCSSPTAATRSSEPRRTA